MSRKGIPVLRDWKVGKVNITRIDGYIRIKKSGNRKHTIHKKPANG